MSKLPIVSAKEFEKILLYLGFQIARQKGVTFSIAIPTGVTPLCRITLEET